MDHKDDVPARIHVRAAGVLLHPTSLPGRYGIGDLGDELIAFLDWAVSAGVRLWQVLPLNPPGYGHSPYGCLSSVAGNFLLISPQRLLQEGLLTPADVRDVPDFPTHHVHFDSVIPWKMELLRKAWRRFDEKGNAEQRVEIEEFEKREEQRRWLEDFALFMALKEQAGGAPWWLWPEPLARCEVAALRKARHDLAQEIRFHKFLQFLFFRQWRSVRAAAAARGIRIIGDVPIYVANDSADVWANRGLFQLDQKGQPTVVAGVPPDYFSTTGQRWGNPLYRWERMKESGFEWWITRLRVNLSLADVIRLDHFRGFAAYWEVPAQESTAIHGRWMPGPGLALFDALRAALGGLPLVAEDLGFITPEVDALRKATGLAGMKILQFGFAQPDSIHLPHRFEANTVAYTGTHDNDTARGWFEQAPPAERKLALAYVGGTEEELPWSLIRAAYTSVADTAIIPAQDILNLGSEARMNRPGADSENWSWRLEAGALTRAHAERLRWLSEISGRM